MTIDLIDSVGWLCYLLLLLLRLVLFTFFHLAALLSANFSAFSSLRFCLADIISKPCFSSSFALSTASVVLQPVGPQVPDVLLLQQTGL